MNRLLNRYLFVIIVTMTASACNHQNRNEETTTADYPRIDNSTDFQRTKALADKGDAIEQHKLGLMYYHGQKVDRSYIKAAAWFRKAAEQGVPSAQSWLGIMYASGRGVDVDYITAYQWAVLGTEQGFEEGERSKASLAKFLNLEEISEAEKLASECYSRNYKACR